MKKFLLLLLLCSIPLYSQNEEMHIKLSNGSMDTIRIMDIQKILFNKAGESYLFRVETTESAYEEYVDSITSISFYPETADIELYIYYDSATEPEIVKTAGLVIEFDDEVGVPWDQEIPGLMSFKSVNPNPFSDETLIEIDIQKTSEPVVMITDAGGRVVRTFSPGTTWPGTFTISWDGRDDSGSAVHSGIYLCTVKNGDALISTKIIHVR